VSGLHPVQDPQAPVILLAGPTACGKSALALELATRLDAEIISVDSALVYQGMDIGTAKPSLAEQAQIPHHLLDVLPPEEQWTAADFVSAAHAAIAGVHARARIPLLVGGTILYFRSLLQALDPMPVIDPAVRSALRARLPDEGSVALHAELQRVDPPSAQRIHPHDPQRILRALEVYYSSGQRLSALQSAAPAHLPASWQFFTLWPEDRRWLQQRIAQRLDAMLQQGFRAELETLAQRPQLTAEHASQRAVGYRQGWQWLSGVLTTQAFRERTIVATRQLAKRQMTALRGLPLPTRALRAEDASADAMLRQLG
jgi:tRNA dimethylallyltransferase